MCFVCGSYQHLKRGWMWVRKICNSTIWWSLVIGIVCLFFASIVNAFVLQQLFLLFPTTTTDSKYITRAHIWLHLITIFLYVFFLLLNICIYFSPLLLSLFLSTIVSFLSLLLIYILHHALSPLHYNNIYLWIVWERIGLRTCVWCCLPRLVSYICISSKVNVRFALLLACLSLV